MSDKYNNLLSLKEELDNLTELDKDTLLKIDEFLKYLTTQQISHRDKEILSGLKTTLSSYNLDNKQYNITTYHLDKILSRSLVDLSSSIDYRVKREVYSLLKEYFDYHNILISSIDYYTLKELSTLIPQQEIEHILKYIEYKENNIDIEVNIEYIDNTLSKIDYIISNISIYNYNTLKDTSRNPDLLGREHKGGGDHNIKYPFFQKHLLNLAKIDIIFNTLSKFNKCSYYLTNTYVNKRIFLSKLTSLLIHIHLSKYSVIPLPRRFLEENGYELFTSLHVYNIKDDFKTSSLYGLQSLGLLNIVKNSEEGSCREVTLGFVSKACLGVLALTHSRLSLKELTLNKGDLTISNMDYLYYYETENFLPNIDLFTKVLNKIPSTKLDVKTYIKNFKENYPICSWSKEDYYDFFKSNINSLRTLELEELDTLLQFDNDIRYLSTGYDISLVSKKNKVSYSNVFTLSYTGRLFQRYGTQGISRKSKTILHNGSINYDIPSSQIRVLLLLLEDIYKKYKGVFTSEDIQCYKDRSFLLKYINEPSFKNELISQIGITSEQWKQCVYALVFGANLTSTYYKSTIMSVKLLNKTNPDFKEDLFFDYLGQLSNPITLWYKYLKDYALSYEMSLEQQLDFNSTIITLNLAYLDYKDYISNGCVFVPKDHYIFSDIKKLSAFFLQGIESSFIFNLVTIIPNITISYEFDGLVTNKEIDTRFLEVARNKSGFLNGTVIVKPFQT